MTHSPTRRNLRLPIADSLFAPTAAVGIRPFAILMTIAFIVTLALAAAHRLRGQALTTLIGLATGAAATTLATFFTTSRRHTSAPPGKRSDVSLSPCHPVPLSQIPSLTDAEQDLAEDQYWRGYRDGWIHAANTMRDLATEQRLSPQAAYYACTRHWQTLLPYRPHPEAQCQP